MDPHQIVKKVGANGQLFGGVKHKDIMEIVKSLVPSNVVTKKWQVLGFNTENSNNREGDSHLGNEIRSAGSFYAMLSLHPEVKSTFRFEVVADG